MKLVKLAGQIGRQVKLVNRLNTFIHKQTIS
jgi:hypothetical protein